MLFLNPKNVILPMLYNEPSTGIAIEAESIGKRYYLNSNILAKLKNAINPYGKKNILHKKEFWALNNLNITVHEGESVGIIGPNGAGKSTLLKLLCRVTKPTTGNIKINGRVGALIEVGAGFHPDFTGRENVYLNASILGMSKKEVNSKFDEIVAFAGIENFIDTPVKHYSSGMYVRLGFAVAVHINPDILLVDEILAVGDFSFQKKCYEKMRNFRDQGKTFLLVSHSLVNIENNCKRVIYINKGIVQFDGNTPEGISCYLNDINDKSDTTDKFSPMVKAVTNVDIELVDVKILNNNNEISEEIITGEDMIVEIEYITKRPIFKPKIEIGIVYDGITIGQTNTYTDGGPAEICGKGKIHCTIKNIPLVAGIYYINIYVNDGYSGADIMVISNVKSFTVKYPKSIRIGCGIPGFVKFIGKWE